MTRLRDLIRREPRRGLAHPAVARPAALDRHRVDRPAGRAAPALRQRRGLCGRRSGLSYIVMTSLYDLRGLLLLNMHNVVLIVTGLVLPFWHRFGENFVAIVRDADHRLRAALRRLDARDHERPAHLLHCSPARCCSSSASRTGSCFSASSSTRAALLLFALNFAPVDGILLPTDGRLRDMISSHTLMSVRHHQCGADLLCADAGAPRRGSSSSSSTSAPRR